MVDRPLTPEELTSFQGSERPLTETEMTAFQAPEQQEQGVVSGAIDAFTKGAVFGIGPLLTAGESALVGRKPGGVPQHHTPLRPVLPWHTAGDRHN